MSPPTFTFTPLPLLRPEDNPRVVFYGWSCAVYDTAASEGLHLSDTGGLSLVCPDRVWQEEPANLVTAVNVLAGTPAVYRPRLAFPNGVRSGTDSPAERLVIDDVLTKHEFFTSLETALKKLMATSIGETHLKMVQAHIGGGPLRRASPRQYVEAMEKAYGNLRKTDIAKMIAPLSTRLAEPRNFLVHAIEFGHTVNVLQTAQKAHPAMTFFPNDMELYTVFESSFAHHPAFTVSMATFAAANPGFNTWGVLSAYIGDQMDEIERQTNLGFAGYSGAVSPSPSAHLPHQHRVPNPNSKRQQKRTKQQQRVSDLLAENAALSLQLHHMALGSSSVVSPTITLHPPTPTDQRVYMYCFCHGYNFSHSGLTPCGVMKSDPTKYTPEMVAANDHSSGGCQFVQVACSFSATAIVSKPPISVPTVVPVHSAVLSTTSTSTSTPPFFSPPLPPHTRPPHSGAEGSSWESERGSGSPPNNANGHDCRTHVRPRLWGKGVEPNSIIMHVPPARTSSRFIP